MVELRICVGDKANTYQKVLNDKEADVLKGLKIGDKLHYLLLKKTHYHTLYYNVPDINI